MSKELSPKKHTYFLFYKPYGVLCQFTGEPGRRTLKDFGPFLSDVYPVGRLDTDSEGLLLLTNDGQTKHLLLEPRYGHERTYLVQVERIPTEDALQRLRDGVLIEGRKTRRATVELLSGDPAVPPRDLPIRVRKNVPTAWLQLTLTEGRNRQVRKMTAAIGHPTLRLIRISIGPLTLSGLRPGEHRHLSTPEIRSLLSFAKQHLTTSVTP
ncbi:MAG: pseudouridine synthase [Bacteroidota bacterium]